MLCYLIMLNYQYNAIHRTMSQFSFSERRRYLPRSIRALEMIFDLRLNVRQYSPRAHRHALPAVSLLAISRTGNEYRNANDGMYHGKLYEK